jgi:flagellar protein FliO/FliZ
MSLITLTDWLSMLGSFAAVIGLLLATLLLLKKMGPKTGAADTTGIKILSVQNLGGRQKLLLVAIKSEQVLIGLSPQNITNLGSWPLEQSSEITMKESETRVKTSASGEKAIFKKIFADQLFKNKD